MSDSMRDLLESLRQQGRFDSSGQFQLDLERALGRMDQFALAEPRHSLRQIVSAAVAGGATRIEVAASRGSCRFTIDNWSFSFETLQELFPSLFVSQRESERAPMRELAIALYGARALGMAGVELLSWGPHGGGHLELDHQRLTLYPLSCSPSPDGVDRTWIRLRPKGVWDQLRWLLDGGLNLAEPNLWHALRLAPIPVVVNGRRVSGPLDVGHCVGLLGFEPSFKWAGSADFGFDVPSPQGLDGYIVLEPDSAGAALNILLHGVLYEVHVELGPPRLRAFFRVDHLDRDLSLSRLVHGEPLERLLAEVKQAARQGILEMTGAVETAVQARAAGHLLQAMDLERRDASWLFRKVKTGLLFRRRDGRRASVGEVMEGYRSRGYLAVAEEAPEAPKDELILREPGTEPLLELLFPSVVPEGCRVELGGTAVLAAAPLGNASGMVCLDPLACEDSYRLRVLDSDGQLQESTRSDELFPAGVEVRYRARWVSAVGGEEVIEAGRKALPELYRRLIRDLPQEPRRRRRANLYLLAYLAYLARPPTTLSRLLREGAQGFTGGDVARVAAVVALPLAAGGAVSLESLLLDGSGTIYYCLAHEPMAPSEGLLRLTRREAALLERTLAPGQLVHLSESYFD